MECVLTNAEKEFIQEMRDIKYQIEHSNSWKRKNDLSKQLYSMQRELKMYRKFQKEAKIKKSSNLFQKKN